MKLYEGMALITWWFANLWAFRAAVAVIGAKAAAKIGEEAKNRVLGKQ